MKGVAIIRGAPDVDLIFMDVDIYFQHLRMLRIIRMSTDVDADIRSTFTKGVDFLIVVGADICFQYLRIRMRMQVLKVIRISG